MRKALLIALVILVIATGIPFLMGMGMMTCADCPLAVMGAGPGCSLLAVLVGIGAAIVFVWSRLSPLVEPLPGRLYAFRLERPPRLVSTLSH